MRPFTGKEWESLPHAILTSGVEWDPTSLDEKFPTEEFYGSAQDYGETPDQSPFGGPAVHKDAKDGDSQGPGEQEDGAVSSKL